MRKVFVAILLLPVVACASMRRGGPEVEGPRLTITNESFAPIDLSYRCTENGPVQRLGAVNPRRSHTFTLRPAFCTTVYIVPVPLAGIHPLGLDVRGAQSIATVHMPPSNELELVFTFPGVLVRREPVAATQPQTDS
jgi:hypothetical protein